MKNEIKIYIGIGVLLLIGVLIFIETSKEKSSSYKFTENRIRQKTNIVDSIYQAENLDINSNYQPLSLHYNGKPIFSIGQKLSEIDSTLAFSLDPNSGYQGYFPAIKDYITTEDKLSLHRIGNQSSINGIVYFSADQQSERVFKVTGTWVFEVFNNNVMDEMKTWFIENLFPELENCFEFVNKWKYKIETNNQTEHFELTKNNRNWTLNYEVELK